MPKDIAAAGAWLAERWSGGLADVIATLTAARPTVDFEVTQKTNPCAWWQQMFDILPEPAIWIGADPETRDTLTRRVLGATGLDAPAAGDIEATWLDLLAQAGNVLAQHLSGWSKTAVTSGDMAEAPAQRAAMQVAVSVRKAGAEPARLWIGFSQPLLDLIAHLEHPAAALGVSLDMVVTLGRTTLPLGDVFKLSTGAIIEFPQSITQPADIAINGRLVAKGQIVVANGNYAVKLISTTFRPAGGES